MSFQNMSLNFNKFVNQNLDMATEHKIVKVVLAITILLYGNLAAPAFPKKFLWVLDNYYFKVLFLAFITWTSHHDPLLGIATASIFLVVIDLINKNQMEKFEGPQTAIYPGCLNMTVPDLLESFSNNKNELLNAMMISRVPFDTKIDDYNAPIIATYLLNHGFALKSPSCSFPTPEQSIGF